MPTRPAMADQQPATRSALRRAHARQTALKSVFASGYNADIEAFREREYPQLNGVTYLDHAAATLYASSAIQSFSADLCSNLYGNPHSPSPSSQLSTKKIDLVRLRVLQLYRADPEEFDLVFCANATAAIKLVAEAFTAQQSGFHYRYHADAHTSLVGLRELAGESQCIFSDAEVENWLQIPENGTTGLFGWPAQSNLTGRRLPQHWPRKLRESHPNYYSLMDAAALLTTAPLDLSDASSAPDFIALSFYKIFGFPDLGGLILRKSSAGILRSRRYFGGGTVDSVVSTKTDFVARKNDDPHSYLEDGTCAFHSIVALDACMTTHEKLYGTPERVAKHAFSLAKLAYDLLTGLAHTNSRKLCVIYSSEDYRSASTQGPIVTFNMQRADGTWIGYAEVEKLASIKNIHLRVGGMCNAGGIELYVGLKAWEIEQNYAAGHKCSDDMDVMNGKPTGAIRVSFGAMSTLDDVLNLVTFLEEFYEGADLTQTLKLDTAGGAKTQSVVESISIYPIKSCGGFKIPRGVGWVVRPHGLAWDREWCVVHLGTGTALSQKSYNKMVLIHPEIDLDAGFLRISASGPSSLNSLQIPLATPPDELKSSASRVCGDKITALMYKSPEVINFFTAAVGVPCTLARFPAELTTRNHKPHLKCEAPQNRDKKEPKILLSNESPILIVNRSSVDELNSHIGRSGGKLAKANLFRANIILRDMAIDSNSAYKEDTWRHVKIGEEFFELLGPCRRCHMVCVDQNTAEKNEEPFVTLSKTRCIGGRVLFGQHAMHLPLESKSRVPTITVGDTAMIWPIEEAEGGEEAGEKNEQTDGPAMEVERGAGVLGQNTKTQVPDGCDRRKVTGKSVKVLNALRSALPSYLVG